MNREIRKKYVYGALCVLFAFAIIVGSTAVYANAQETDEQPAPTLSVTVSDAGALVDGTRYLVGYVGESLSTQYIAQNIRVKKADEEEFTSVSAQQISVAEHTFTQEGAQSVTVTVAGETGVVPVWVYTTQEIEPLLPEQIGSYAHLLLFHFETQIDGGENTRMAYFNVETDTYGAPQDLATLRTPTMYDGTQTYTLREVGQASEKQMLVSFSSLNASNLSALPVGSVLSLGENFRFYRYLDDVQTYAALYKLSKPTSYVWTGTQWENFVADTEDFTLTETKKTLPIGGVWRVGYTLLPQGSCLAVTLSSPSNIVEIRGDSVVGKRAGKTIVTVTVGNVSKELEIAVADSTPIGFALANDRTYYVAQNSVLPLQNIAVVPDYGDEVYGEAFYLRDEDCTYTFDSSVAGEQTVSVTVEKNGLRDTFLLRTDVIASTEPVPTDFWSAEDAGNFIGGIVVHFGASYPNKANLDTDDFDAQSKQSVNDNIEFWRDGQKAVVHNVQFLTNLLVISLRIDGKPVSRYRQGDTLILKKGLSLYCVYGKTASDDGDLVCVAKTGADMQYVYGKNNRFALQIQYSDFAVQQENLYLTVGEKATCQSRIVPSYATVGEFYYESKNPEVASVDMNGKITAMAVGTTEIKVYLEGGNMGELEKTISVTVADAPVALRLNIAGLRQKEGQQLLGEVLQALGVTAAIGYQSGKSENIDNLSVLSFDGYDPNRTGTQSVTVRYTKDGIVLDTVIEVTVQSASQVPPPDTESSGCNASVFGSIEWLSAVTLLLSALVCGLGKLHKERRSNKKQNTL